jgi:SAM-dependent MidA family methyltransferase
VIGAEGAISFERFMDLALYGDQGFYTRVDGGSAGRRGDFITSPEVGPLFGAVVAHYLDAEWERIGRPDPFTVIDAGAGPGTLARSVAVARPACIDAMRYVAVEISVAQRDRHPDGVDSQGDLPPGPVDGVVVCNELLDNLAFRLLVHDDGWREAFVEIDRSGRFVEVLSTALGDVPAALPGTAPFGARAPLIDRASCFVDHARSLVRSGSVLAIDYGVALTAELAMRPWRDWLRTYRSNDRGTHYLSDVGLQDITIDVPFDQLPPADAMRSQAQFLQRWGIDDLVGEGVRVWTEQAAQPGLEAMRMRSRVSESEALLDPVGLGAFEVAEWRSP